MDELVRAVDDPLAVAAARRVLDFAREEILAGAEPGDLAERLAQSSRRHGAGAPPGPQRDRGARPHEPRPGAARRGGDRAGDGGGARLLEPRVRPRRRARAARARITSRAILRRVTGAEAALVVNNNAAAVLLALAALAEGREVRRLARRADRDRRRLPHPRRARPLGRAARRGRDDEPHERRRLRARDRARHRAAAARAPVELPRRRLHRAAGASPSSPRSLARHGLPLVDDLGSGALVDARATSRPSPPRSPRAPTSSASRATSCSAGRRRGSSSAAPTLVERLRRHPLQRALRADKLTLAALEGTLASISTGPTRCRCCACCASRVETVRARAERLAEAHRRRRSRRRSRGSAAARCRSPSCRASRARSRRSSAAPLRGSRAAGVGVVRDGRTLLDCRTLADGEVDEVAAAVARMPLTVGTAGHIDHGKTWLVRALTGKDTDRLPEEQRARDLDRPRLRAARASRRPPALARRRARATSASSGTWSRARPGSTSSCS